jgi:hypothetical protein
MDDHVDGPLVPFLDLAFSTDKRWSFEYIWKTLHLIIRNTVIMEYINCRNGDREFDGEEDECGWNSGI